MPAAIPVVVGWATAAFSTAVTATAGLLGSFGAVAALGEGATIALAGAIVKTAAVAGLSVAAAALLRPNVPSSGQTLDFKPDPKAPITGMMGYAATGGNKVFQNTWGYKGVALTLGVALSLGPIDAITRFTADDALVTFSGAEQEAVGYFDDDMWLKTTLGTPSDPHLTPPTTPKYGSPPLSGWDSTHKAPGTAFALWTLLVAKNEDDRDIFTQGVPDPRWTGRWMKVYDWRKDSTQVGGSGAQRENDWRTWQWSENPYVHARAWLRGHFKLNTDGTLDYNKRIAGVGMPPSAIDLPAFTEGANVADANNWVISGSWSTSDQKWQVLAAMLKAGGGQPINRGAQVSVLVNTPRVSTYTYTRDDMVGQAEVQPMTRRRERKNTIVPRYRSEAHSWEYVAAKEVTSSVYRTEDRGEPRSYEVEYSYVRLPKQAAQLAAYDLVNLREGLTVTLPSKVHLMSVHAGDCITVDVPDMALANQKVVVVRTITDYKNATVTLECRSETDGKHAFALGQAAEPPPSPTLSRIDPYYIPPPIADEWEVVAKPPVGGTSQPVIIVVGNPGTSDVASVIVEYGLSATGPWVSAGSADVTTGQYQINGLNPGAQYWISIRYVSNNGAVSDRYVTGPHTAPGFIADTINRFPDGTAPIWNYPTFADLPMPPLDGQIVAWVEDEEKLYEYRNGVWTKKIDGGDIDPGTLSNLAFAAGIRAPGLGDALPTLPNSSWPIGAMFVLTTDGKTYTNIGNTWQVKVDGADIVANSIVAGKLAAGAVTAQAIAAKAIVASSLYVGDTSNMIPDGLIVDPSSWVFSTSASAIVPSSPSATSTNRFNILASASDVNVYSVWFPVEELTQLYVSAFIGYGSGVVGGAGSYLYLNTGQVDGSGNVTSISQNAAFGPQAAMTRGKFGGQITVPAGANVARIRFRRIGGGTATALFDSPIVRRAASNELVVDGGITAVKLSSNAVTSDKITAGAVTAGKINVTNLAAINADLGVVTAGMLRSGSGGNRTEVTPTGVKIYTNGVLTAAIGEW